MQTSRKMVEHSFKKSTTFLPNVRKSNEFANMSDGDVVAPLCNPLTLQPEQSGGVGSSPGRAPPLERHDKGLWTRLGLLYFRNPSTWC